MTLAEHYGIPRDEEVDDVTWLADTAGRGWVALGKDARIRRQPAEKAAVRRHGARCFSFTRGDLPAEVYVERILANLDAITGACTEVGPFIYVRHPNRIERMGCSHRRAPPRAGRARGACGAARRRRGRWRTDRAARAGARRAGGRRAPYA